MNQDHNETPRYFQVTPSGAYYATLSTSNDALRALLLQLLSADTHIPYLSALLQKLTGLPETDAHALLDKAVQHGFVDLPENPDPIASGTIEQLLPEYLPRLADGRVLLADDQGFCLGQSGFDPDEAEAVAGMAADLVSLHERHQSLLARHLGFDGSSWALVDAVGQSELGFWTLHVGEQKFLLILEGMPHLNRQPFVDLMSVLIRRYLDY
ncbi:hypothetical protein [Marinobacterium stanieri]|uniref:hypothetical protein n=1 Tax=Marinobacterium stanieri TaxID=49186 RepID=UPI0004979C6F|nr:hypothetical protein [Marinobacterium stanieri]